MTLLLLIGGGSAAHSNATLRNSSRGRTLLLPITRRRTNTAIWSTGHTQNQNQNAAVEGGVGLGYIYTTLQVGTPPRPFTVVLDTGSPLLVVPCVDCPRCGHLEHRYNPRGSSSAVLQSSTFSISYVEGSTLAGRYYTDRVGIGGTPPVVAAVGCATTMTHLFRSQFADGICGLDASANSFVQLLRANHRLRHNTLGLHLCAALSGVDAVEIGAPAHEFGSASTPVVEEEERQWFAMTRGRATFSIETRAGGGFGAAARWLLDTGTTFIYLQPSQLAAIRRLLPTPDEGPSDRSDVGCYVRRHVHLPTLRMEAVKPGSATLYLTPPQYTYSPAPDWQCVGMFATGWGHENTLGLLALEGRRVLLDLDHHSVAFASC